MLYTNRLKAIPPIPLDKMNRGKCIFLAVARVVKEEKCGRILIVDVYKRDKKHQEYVARFCCDGENYNAYDVVNDKWQKKKIRSILAQGKDMFGYYSYSYDSAYNGASSAESIETVKKYLKGFCGHWNDDIFDWLDAVCWKKNYERNQRAFENKRNRIDTHIKMFPNLPNDFIKFLREYVFKGYMFISKVENGQRTGVCTFCHKTISLSKDVKHKSIMECPKCHKAVYAWKNWLYTSIKEKKTVCVAYRVDDQLLLRWLKVADHWDKNSETGELEPYYTKNDYFRTMYLNEKKGQTIRHYYYKNIYPYGAEWRDANWSQDDAAYIYTSNLNEVFGDVYYKVNLKQELEKHFMPLHFVRLLDNLKHNAATEYLVKMGMPRLASQIYEADINEGRSFGEILGINPQYKQMFMKYNVSLDELRMVKAANGWVSEADFLKMRALNLNSYHVQEIIELLEKEPYRRLANYLAKQKKLYHPRTIDQILLWYKDYIKMSEQMQIDLSRKAVRYPKDIKEAHDNLVKRYKIVEQEIYDEQLRQATKNLYAGLTEYKNDGYAIVFPRTRTEFIQEGQALSHCVGSQESYFKNHLAGTKMIFFIRREEEIDKPFVTMEIDMGRCVILQIYGFGDKRPEQDVINFANKFLRQLKHRDDDVRRTA